jgi:hypothetical protein
MTGLEKKGNHKALRQPKENEELRLAQRAQSSCSFQPSLFVNIIIATTGIFCWWPHILSFLMCWSSSPFTDLLKCVFKNHFTMHWIRPSYWLFLSQIIKTMLKWKKPATHRLFVPQINTSFKKACVSRNGFLLLLFEIWWMYFIRMQNQRFYYSMEIFITRGYEKVEWDM